MIVYVLDGKRPIFIILQIRKPARVRIVKRRSGCVMCIIHKKQIDVIICLKPSCPYYLLLDFRTYSKALFSLLTGKS